ncbi:hypothetical protein J7L68_01475 [bacterium]|nr:hypothetical protein [bacterium]
MNIRVLKIFIILLFSIAVVQANEFVIVRGETLFVAKSSTRAHEIEHIVGSIIESGTGNSQNVFVEKTDSGWCIGYDTLILMCFPVSLGDSAEILSQNTCHKLSMLIDNPPKKSQLGWNELLKLLLALLSPIIFVIIILLINKIVKKIIHYFLYQEGKLIKGIKIGKFTILPARDELMLTITIVRWIRNILAIILFYVMLLFIFHLYPATQEITDKAILLSFKFLGNVGIVALKVLGYAVGAFAFYLIACIVMKIIDLLFRHYLQNPDSTLPADVILNFRTILKIFISILFVLGFIAIIPKYGYIIALVGLFILLAVLGISFIPILKQYITAYTFHKKGLLSVGDKIFYKDRWWIVSETSSLFLKLQSLSDDEIAIISIEDILSGGFSIRQKQRETDSNVSENDNSVSNNNKNIDITE